MRDEMRDQMRDEMRDEVRDEMRNLRRKKACHRQYIFGLDETWRGIKSVLQFCLYFVDI